MVAQMFAPSIFYVIENGYKLLIGKLVPQGGSYAFKNQKSKVLWNELFRDFKWLLYFRRGVLAADSML
ncbi:MAG: hypothetical protein V7L20_27430 [Nostoc sp.]